MRRIFIVTTILVVLGIFAVINIQSLQTAEREDDCSLIVAYGDVFSTKSGAKVIPSTRTLPDLLTIPYNCATAYLRDTASTEFSYTSPVGRLEGVNEIERKLLELDALATAADDTFLKKQAAVGWRLAETVSHDRMETLKKVNDGINEFHDFDLFGIRSSNAGSVDTYISNCRSHGVPVPGPIGDGNWDELSNIDDDYTFFKPELQKRAWIFLDENEGTCVSFARIAEDDEPFLGTICASADRSKACFFDNVIYENGGTRRLNLADSLETRFEDRVHIVDVGEACANCHIGDNPFLLHPGTKLAEYLNPDQEKTKPQQFEFVPFGVNGTTWCNPNPLQFEADNSACASCHHIPQVYKGSEYCLVLQFAVTNTMPPNHPGALSWPDEHGDFADMDDRFDVFRPSLLKLREMCSSSATGTCSSDQ